MVVFSYYHLVGTDWHCLALLLRENDCERGSLEII